MLLSTALTCLALNIYHEGRGETELGKKIIAQTVMNRANGNDANVCREVMKPYQFSWTKNLVVGRQLKPRGMPKEQSAWESCKEIAKEALSGELSVPSKYKNVTNFHTLSSSPPWKNRMIKLGRVDGHIYYQAKQP